LWSPSVAISALRNASSQIDAEEDLSEEEALSLEVCTSVMASSRLAPEGKTKFLVDGGSNTVLSSDKIISMRGVHSPLQTSIVGIWNNNDTITTGVTFNVLFVGNAPSIELFGPYNASARRNVLSESYLWDTHKMQVLKEPVMRIVFHDSPELYLDLFRENGLYFIYGDVMAPPGPVSRRDGQVYSFETMVVNAPYGDKVSGLQRKLLWAARLGGGHRTINEAVVSTRGTGLAKVTSADEVAINSDVFRTRAWARNKPVKSIGQGASYAPGELLVVDAAGPEASPAIGDGAHYHIFAVCAATTFGHDGAATSIDPDVMISFLTHCFAAEEAVGNRTKIVRLDADPKLVKAMGIQKVEAFLNKEGRSLQAGPGFRHESVAHAEQRIDTTTRIADESLARARKGGAYRIRARIMASKVLNLRCRRGESKTRYEMHNRQGAPDFTKMAPPLCFGTLVAYTANPQTKSGGLDAKRPVAEVIGLKKNGYLILSLETRRTLDRHKDQVWVLNELELAARGRPENFAAGVSTDVTPTTPSSSSAPVVPPTDALANNVFPVVTEFEKTCDPALVGPVYHRTMPEDAVRPGHRAGAGGKLQWSCDGYGRPKG